MIDSEYGSSIHLPSTIFFTVPALFQKVHGDNFLDDFVEPNIWHFRLAVFPISDKAKTRPASNKMVALEESDRNGMSFKYHPEHPA